MKLFTIFTFSLVLTTGPLATLSHADGMEEEPRAAVKAKVIADAAPGLDRATGERLSMAIGHYARARSMLVAALNEFDKALKYANPDALIDATEWRNSVVQRAEELQKVIDPQPRVTRGGIKFDADTRLLNESRE